MGAAEDQVPDFDENLLDSILNAPLSIAQGNDVQLGGSTNQTNGSFLSRQTSEVIMSPGAGIQSVQPYISTENANITTKFPSNGQRDSELVCTPTKHKYSNCQHSSVHHNAYQPLQVIFLFLPLNP